MMTGSRSALLSVSGRRKKETLWMHEPVQLEEEFDFKASMARFNKQEFMEFMKVR
jgi:hypothetical protein